eukprot:COSAG01_NODE_4976_length_4577_cov_4.889013_3_plen_103_part_00
MHSGLMRKKPHPGAGSYSIHLSHEKVTFMAHRQCSVHGHGRYTYRGQNDFFMTQMNEEMRSVRLYTCMVDGYYDFFMTQMNEEMRSVRLYTCMVDGYYSRIP